MLNRGAYLVEGPGHCAECHSPRDIFGGLIPGRRFAGGVDAEGKGWVPNITPHADGLAKWSEKDIAYLLETGTTPDYDSVGSTMADVAANTAKLSPEDRAAMAAYLKSLPPRPGKNPQEKVVLTVDCGENGSCRTANLSSQGAPSVRHRGSAFFCPIAAAVLMFGAILAPGGVLWRER